MAQQDPPVETTNVVPSTKHPYFPHYEINAELWDKYTPYQLMIVEASEPDSQGLVSYKQTGWRFTLPISPQELTLDMPIATNLQATLTGVTSQHGGAPFKNISLQGTTGVAPIKNSGAILQQRGVVESIFAGTVQNLSRAATGLSKVVGDGPRSTNLNNGLGESADDDSRIPKESTGYYQMRLMERFLESYVQLKTDGPGVLSESDALLVTGIPVQRLRLAFCMWKDESVYLVEPLQFAKRRTVASPMEYMFTLQLRAYKRVILNRSSEGKAHVAEFAARKPSILANIFNRVRAARETLSALNDVIESVVSDPVNLTAEAIREVSLFLSEVSGTKAALSDLPRSISDDAFAPISAEWATLRNRFNSLVGVDTDKALLAGRTLDETQKAELRTKVMPNLSYDAIRLPSVTRAKVQAEISRVKKFGRFDFEKARDKVQESAADFADRIGAGHQTISDIYGRAAPLTGRTPTDAEMDILFSLNELAICLDHLAVSSQIDPPVPSSLEYVAGLAERSGIAFRVPRSKRAIPFPYGTTLERLAAMYLGDVNRWHEIATLNGLRAPYIDETGFRLELLANGDRSTVPVADVSNLFQGQTVWLVANGVRREKRHIRRIETLSTTYHIVTLDGEPDLQRFTTSGQAFLEAFTPGTVNSQQVIYIPSDVAAPEDPRTKQVPGVNEFDGLLQTSGIDLLLTTDGDLVITPDGDCRLAYGLANIVQTVRLALSTPRGALLQHPEYGIAIKAGTSTADVDAKELLKMATDMFAKDPMFTGVRSASVFKDGPVLKLMLDVGVSGTSDFLPITVAIK